MFPINSGAKQGCVLAPMLFGIFFSLLLSKALSTSQDGIFIHPRNDGKLFKPIVRKDQSDESPDWKAVVC